MILIPTTTKFLASVAVWYLEYGFCLCCIYVQLLEHYERRLWDFVTIDGGKKNFNPYLAIVSRFSLWDSFDWMRPGGLSQSSSAKEADAYLCLSTGESKTVKNE